MASQHAIAFSDRVRGLGHFQAAPFGCSRLLKEAARSETNTVATGRTTGDYNHECQTDASAAKMAYYVAESFRGGRVANPANLRDRPVWVYAGAKDTIVFPAVGAAAATFYRALGSDVRAVTMPGAEHAFATDHDCDVCHRCGYLGRPFVNYCGFDMVGHMLAHVLGELRPRAGWRLGSLRQLSQPPFFPENTTAAQIGMGPTAYAYVPQACAGAGSCRLHVAYHGCSSSVAALGGLDIVLHAGYNGWAEANRLVVLYPQTLGPLCWDWTGTMTTRHTDLYDTRASPQLGTVNRMVDAVHARRGLAPLVDVVEDEEDALAPLGSATAL